MIRGGEEGGNIYVFPSGRYMISNDTFPEYFYKSDIQGRAIDMSYDLEIFVRYIAPELGISVRFAGEEPFDSVTRRYNRTMECMLNKHGIRFCEVKRLEDENGVISATRARKCIDVGDMEGLAKLVPLTTKRIIESRYMKGVNT